MIPHFEKSPKGIVYDVNPNSADNPLAKSWYSRDLTGKWFRVMPKPWKDVVFLQSLTPHSEKCAASVGHGILISEAARNRLGS